jgi:non-structural maintenance of chromosomes element 4
VDEQHEAGAARHQAIFTLDYRTWQKLIVAMDIESSLIPHRNDEAEQVTAAGWYG